MQASFDLFDETPSTVGPAAPPEPVRLSRRASTELHPFGAPKTRAKLRDELEAANVATVRFDVQEGVVTRVSQFIPAGNQCIGLYPEPLKAIGRDMLDQLTPRPEAWSGVVEWDVAANRPRCHQPPDTDEEQPESMERPCV